MTGAEFEKVVKHTFERRGFTHISVHRKLFRKYADVYAKYPKMGKTHHTCSLVIIKGKSMLAIRQADVDLVSWIDQMELLDAAFDD